MILWSEGTAIVLKQDTSKKYICTMISIIRISTYTRFIITLAYVDISKSQYNKIIIWYLNTVSRPQLQNNHIFLWFWVRTEIRFDYLIHGKPSWPGITCHFAVVKVSRKRKHFDILYAPVYSYSRIAWTDRYYIYVHTHAIQQYLMRTHVKWTNFSSYWARRSWEFPTPGFHEAAKRPINYLRLQSATVKWMRYLQCTKELQSTVSCTLHGSAM